jgi:hypothetical protein
MQRKSIGRSERRSGGERSRSRGESSNPRRLIPDRDHPDTRFVRETAATLAGR